MKFLGLALVFIACLVIGREAFREAPVEPQASRGVRGQQQDTEGMREDPKDESPVRIKVPNAQAETPAWLLDLLFGHADGIAGYTEALSGIQNHTLDPGRASVQILGELIRDNNGSTQLRNTLVISLLREDPEPSERTVVQRSDYLSADAGSQIHVRMMALLKLWPVDEATRTLITELLAEITQAESQEDLQRLIRELLKLGPAGSKALSGLIVNRTRKDASKAMPLVIALLETTTEPDTISMLLNETAATQWIEGNERASDAINSIGVAVRTYLAGDLGLDTESARAQAIRAVLMEVASGKAVDQAVGLGVTAAIALGGGKQDDPMIAGFLARASKTWPTLAANTALVNLGYAADPSAYLAYVPWPMTPPTDRERMVRHADYLSGLTVAMRRHPDQEGLVLPYISDALRTWRSSRFEVMMCEHILGMVQNMDIRSAKPVLMELRSGANKRLSKRAGQILDAWK